MYGAVQISDFTQVSFESYQGTYNSRSEWLVQLGRFNRTMVVSSGNEIF